jgi:hypothetical protein
MSSGGGGGSGSGSGIHWSAKISELVFARSCERYWNMSNIIDRETETQLTDRKHLVCLRVCAV